MRRKMKSREARHWTAFKLHRIEELLTNRLSTSGKERNYSLNTCRELTGPMVEQIDLGDIALMGVKISVQFPNISADTPPCMCFETTIKGAYIEPNQRLIV
jgi:hypothetical protein